jgi:hypothetical protein
MRVVAGALDGLEAALDALRARRVYLHLDWVVRRPSAG